MKVCIESADNGYIVRLLGDAEVCESILIYAYDEFTDCRKQEVETFASALRAVERFIGPATSRHSEARVYVRVEPGDKYEPQGRDSE